MRGGEYSGTLQHKSTDQITGLSTLKWRPRILFSRSSAQRQTPCQLTNTPPTSIPESDATGPASQAAFFPDLSPTITCRVLRQKQRLPTFTKPIPNPCSLCVNSGRLLKQLGKTDTTNPSSEAAILQATKKHHTELRGRPVPEHGSLISGPRPFRQSRPFILSSTTTSLPRRLPTLGPLTIEDICLPRRHQRRPLSLLPRPKFYPAAAPTRRPTPEPPGSSNSSSPPPRRNSAPFGPRRSASAHQVVLGWGTHIDEEAGVEARASLDGAVCGGASASWQLSSRCERWQCRLCGRDGVLIAALTKLWVAAKERSAG